MKQIIETIKVSREELISKYYIIKKELDNIKEGMKQARKLNAEEVYDNLWVKRSDLVSEMKDFDMTINDLTNALNHLGEKTDIFWGE